MDTTSERALAPRDTPVRELIVQLGELLSSVARTRSDKCDRHKAIVSICDALASRGIDADSLIRFGMQSVVVNPLVAWLMLERLVGDAGEQRPVLEFASWHQLLGLTSVTVSEADGTLTLSSEGLRMLTEAVKSLSLWVEEAPLSEIIDATPPTSEIFSALQSRPRSTSDLVAIYSWVYERFAVTDIEQWAVASLHNELRWVLHMIPPPVAQEIMEVATFEENELNRLIARQAVSPKTRNDLWDPLLQPLQDQASTFLQQRRFREAGALFEFYERQNPDHPGAKNNRGFCLIPANPEEALHHVKASERAGYTPRSIAVYNSCCCYWSMNQKSKILDISEYYWQRELELEPAPCTLWRLEEGTWTLYREPDARLALARLALDSAAELGEMARVDAWRHRIQELTN